MKFVRNKVFIFPMREGKMNAVVQRPTLSSLPEGEGSFTFLSAQKSEAKRRAKRYPYFPLPENMDAIAHHPTPTILPAGRKYIEAPAP